jgi:hypothetical protein
VEDIMPPPPPNDPDLRSTKEWTNEITGMSGISKLAKFFLQQKQELNNRRKNENKNEIDTDYRLKRKRDFNATIRACKKTVDSLILLPTYFSSPQLHSLIFKLQNFIIEINNNILVKVTKVENEQCLDIDIKEEEEEEEESKHFYKLIQLSQVGTPGDFIFLFLIIDLY